MRDRSAQGQTKFDSAHRARDHAVMFVVEFASGLIARPLHCFLILWIIWRRATTPEPVCVSRGGGKGEGALFKGADPHAALFVWGGRLWRSASRVPVFELMGAISLLALAANGTCLALLWKNRSEDINMTRYGSARATTSPRTSRCSSPPAWCGRQIQPGLILCRPCLAALLLRSAYKVTRTALAQLRAPLAQPVRFQIRPRS